MEMAHGGFRCRFRVCGFGMLSGHGMAVQVTSDIKRLKDERSAILGRLAVWRPFACACGLAESHVHLLWARTLKMDPCIACVWNSEGTVA